MKVKKKQIEIYLITLLIIGVVCSCVTKSDGSHGMVVEHVDTLANGGSTISSVKIANTSGDSIYIPDGKVALFEHCDWNLSIEEKSYKDTVINGYGVKWRLIESLNKSDVVGWYYERDHYETDDTLKYYYGLSGIITITASGMSKMVADTITISNRLLRKCINEEGIISPKYGIYYDLIEIEPPILVGDTLRFKIVSGIMDTDACIYYHYDWTAQGDKLYTVPDPHPWLDDEDEYKSVHDYVYEEENDDYDAYYDENEDKYFLKRYGREVAGVVVGVDGSGDERYTIEFPGNKNEIRRLKVGGKEEYGDIAVGDSAVILNDPTRNDRYIFFYFFEPAYNVFNSGSDSLYYRQAIDEHRQKIYPRRADL